ncbi:MAG: bifunctional diaminohydroxyphosphoribosylaminopyrimidine deaminase/5-amino-6-(5-phosphoribosylamino)uracil reductase RibD [Putridiphycobacter sp.]
MSDDIKYMQRALELAELGRGQVAPNPMVGSVIVYAGKIIGEGYHEKCGEAHAEVNAINSVKDKELLQRSTIYVNLEPCAHFGKTPPCSNLIIDSKIPRVVIGCVDSYAEVAGKGVEKMRKAGIDVQVGVLEMQALDLNRRFFKFHAKKRPYIILKWAQSQNRKMDVERANGETGVFWITQPETKMLVHKWRMEEAGVLVGRKTVEVDNPTLTARDCYGKNPLRIVIDQNLKIDYTNRSVANDDAKTIVFNGLKTDEEATISFVKIEHFTLERILSKLYELEIQSVIVEGGKKTLENFIADDLWDEARVLTGIGHIESGTDAPCLNSKVSESYFYGKDKVEIYYNG